MLDTPRSGASECENQWQRVAQIIQSEIARAESLPDLQARAIHAVEAADEAVTSLLAECRLTNGSTDTAGVRQEQDAVPTPIARPLAA
jgi:hypothetical protein